MPYIAIKGYPKDEATKQEIAQKITALFQEVWGCPREAITVSVEEVPPDRWAEDVVQAEIEPKKDRMLILSGEPQF